jgi:hypothetical protein
MGMTTKITISWDVKLQRPGDHYKCFWGSCHPSPPSPYIHIILSKFESLFYPEDGGSRDSAASIATALLAGEWRGRSSSSARVINFLFSASSRPALGPTQPPIQWVPGVISLGVKRLGRQASPPTSAEVKNTWIYTSTPPYVFMA